MAICMHAVRAAVRLQVLLTHPSRLRALPTLQPRTSVSHTWNLTAAVGSKGSKTSGLKLGHFRCRAPCILVTQVSRRRFAGKSGTLRDSDSRMAPLSPMLLLARSRRSNAVSAACGAFSTRVLPYLPG